MAGKTPEITSRVDLETWLSDKPIEWARVVAARAALRVLPLLAPFVATNLNPDAKEAAGIIILPAFRAVSCVSGMAGLAETNKIARAAVRAAAAAAARAADVASGCADAAAFGAADAAAFAADATAAFAAAFDTAAAARFGKAAVFAARAAGTAKFSNYIFDDCIRLERGETPADAMQAALWRISGEAEYGNKVPGKIGYAWDKIRQALLSRAEEDWGVWTDWYEARLAGEPANAALETDRILIDDENPGIWIKSPVEINGVIRDIIERYEGMPPARGTPVADESEGVNSNASESTREDMTGGKRTQRIQGLHLQTLSMLQLVAEERKRLENSRPNSDEARDENERKLELLRTLAAGLDDVAKHLAEDQDEEEAKSIIQRVAEKFEKWLFENDPCLVEDFFSLSLATGFVGLANLFGANMIVATPVIYGWLGGKRVRDVLKDMPWPGKGGASS